MTPASIQAAIPSGTGTRAGKSRLTNNHCSSDKQPLLFALTTVETRRGERLLVTTRRREPRKFIDPRKAMLLLREIGIHEMRVDGTQWRPEEAELEKTVRPDRAVAMKQAHEAVGHDKWFREQVEQGIKEADDPNTLWLSNDEAEARAAERRTRWLARGRGAEGEA